MQISKVLIKDRKSFSIKDKLKELGAWWDADRKVWYFPYSDMYGNQKAAAQRYLIQLKKSGFNLVIEFEKEQTGEFEFDNLGGKQ